MYKHYCLFTCTTCLVGQSFKERFLLRRASVRDNPERVRVSLSRLRVQRYGNFFIHASISITFLRMKGNFLHFNKDIARVH